MEKPNKPRHTISRDQRISKAKAWMVKAKIAPVRKKEDDPSPVTDDQIAIIISLCAQGVSARGISDFLKSSSIVMSHKAISKLLNRYL